MFYTRARYRATVRRFTPDDRLPRPRDEREKASLKLPPHRPLPHLSARRVCQPILVAAPTYIGHARDQ